ncbi:hypothetical protein NE237_007675 [Protea cynaroides]|uniref:FBD domain-containing protein n=1 Tax=Protea cynaroides TaxID=273540 RepID=A0A9Q0KPV8_9MAGN|nr:hypothetical protein NE237_007675 [Protea cynaroides]
MQLAHIINDFKPRERPSNFPHSHLKFVEVNGFAGFSEQIDIITYILKNAISLQSLLIDHNQRFYLGDGRWSINDRLCLLCERERRRIYKLLLEESHHGVQLTILSLLLSFKVRIQVSNSTVKKYTVDSNSCISFCLEEN